MQLATIMRQCFGESETVWSELEVSVHHDALTMRARKVI